MTHIPTGFPSIDREYGGVRKGIVTEVMMHTGDGKSALLRQLAEAGARAGVGVLAFFGEDPEDATAERQFAGDTGIATSQIGRLDLSSSELGRIDHAAESAKVWGPRILPIFMQLGVDEVLEYIDQNKTVNGCPVGLVLLDYAQIFGDLRNLEEEIARLGMGLHTRSRERGFASVLASQVATEVIRRGRDGWYQNKDVSRMRPSLGDTEWCRRCEKMCKAIWAVYRPGRWIREFGGEADDDTAEFHVIKANFGPLGWIPMGWDGTTCRFLER